MTSTSCTLIRLKTMTILCFSPVILQSGDVHFLQNQALNEEIWWKPDGVNLNQSYLKNAIRWRMGQIRKPKAKTSIRFYEKKNSLGWFYLVTFPESAESSRTNQTMIKTCCVIFAHFSLKLFKPFLFGTLWNARTLLQEIRHDLSGRIGLIF